MKARKWFTAIPLRYRGPDPNWWNRDAGLLCLGLRQLGLESKFVLMGEEQVQDDPPQVTATMAQLEDARWWAQWKLDGVIFYSWGDPRYEAMARAIHESGARLVVRLDSDGNQTPRVWFWRFFSKTYFMFRDYKKPAPLLFAVAKTILQRLFPGIYDLKFQRHLELADVVLIESPIARAQIQRYLLQFGRSDLARRVKVAAHPVHDRFSYDPAIAKDAKIVAVGRWEVCQKDAAKLIRTLAVVLKARPEYTALIVGSGADEVKRLIKAHARDTSSRIQVTGRVPSEKLPEIYQPARIIFVASRFESFHIAAAEALCCGCTVVGPVAVPSMNWLVSKSSGSLAGGRTVRHFADALNCEIDAWADADRDPVRISQEWRQRFVSTEVARSILSM